MTGLFVVIEGPNGVGKTTAATLLAKRLREGRARSVRLTTEPSDTPLGRLLRSAEDSLTGRALALAVAADRCAHVEREILPWLASGQHVVCDRYVQSSLVLQRIDGLDLAEIWRYNGFVVAPAVSIYLEHDPGVICARLAARDRRSRLELAGSPSRELVLYREAYNFLDRLDWAQVILDCRGRTPDDVVAAILERLGEFTGKPHTE